MEEKNFRRHRIAGLLGVVAIVAAACSSSGGSPAASTGGGASVPAASTGGGASVPAGSPGAIASLANIGGEVSVYGTWTGSEQDSFLAMIKPWADATGVKVNYTGQRDLNAALTQGIAGGTLPDVAGLPGPGPMKEWYATGSLKPLDFVDFAKYESETPPGFAAAGKAPDGKLVGVFTKAAVKGLIWHTTKNWTAGVPKTWDEMNTAAKAAATGQTKEWCIGIESGGDSGWPGTDWIEDFVLRQAGPTVYDAWVNGKQKWSSTEIKTAYQTFGDAVANAYGGSNFIVTTNFGKAANPMFATPPGCLLHHQASFITDFFKTEAKAAPTDYDFFVMPDISPQYTGSITTAGDLFGMFNSTPQAQSLIQYLLTAPAQEIWVKRGGFISMNKGVPLSSYPDEASKRSAGILTAAKNAKFDAGDLMPNAMNKAFFKSIVDYVQNPGNLDSILAGLDKTQSEAYTQ